jgi:catechol 2,3-dioxygenase-like lactoylglutathione lyase family enzyme
MKHLALPVSDQEASRQFYETYFGFGAKPARWYDGGVLMLYNADGFSLALGPPDGSPRPSPTFLHFGIGLANPDAVFALRDRLASGGMTIVEQWDEPDYVSVKCLDPDGFVVEAAWDPHHPGAESR